jgi:sigma-B regulation protein RsbU (phosphoserine phosphatase)
MSMSPRPLAAQCAVALQRALLIEEQLVKQKLERDLALARDIQMRVLPTELPQVDGYDLAGWSTPADETGGDIYDAAACGDQCIALLLGDATGHGIGPALSVTQVRAMFRMALRLRASLDEVFTQVNDQLVDDLPGNRFVTAFLGRLSARTHELAYHAGGQGPLLHYHAADDRCQWLEASTLPLGIMEVEDLEAPPPMKLEPGDIVGLISDGIYEYQNEAGTQFGDDGVARVIRDHRTASSEELITALRQAVADFAGEAPQLDDMTILFIKRT